MWTSSTTYKSPHPSFSSKVLKLFRIFRMNSPHVSPPNFLTDIISNLSEKSSTPSIGSVKSGWNFMHKKKASTLTKENVEEVGNVEDKRYYSSPYYKGLLNTKKVLGTSPESETAAITHDLQNLNLSSPYYRGLLYTEALPGAIPEAESTTGVAHELNLNSPSPYYKGLLNTDRPPPAPTSPDRESQATTFASSSSRTSLSVKMQEWSTSCFSFKIKDEKAPTMIKVYSTELLNEESLRERGSESSPPPLSTPLPPSPISLPPLPPSPAKRVVINAKDTSEPKEGKKYLWADKYRPAALKDFICNKDKANELKSKTAAIILREADKLSTDALLYIRWVIERYRGCHKIFFCCQDSSKLQPLKTVCKVVQLLSPSNKEIIEVLEFIARKEGIELPKQLAERIAINSKNNLRQAIRSFEATWQYNSLLEEDQVILTGWEDDIADIAKSIVEKQSPKQLYDIRRKLQHLIDHSVPPEFIFETLAIELKKNVEETMHNQIDKMYKDYNGSNKLQGYERRRNEEGRRYPNDERRDLMHQFMSIEEFIAKSMSCYKNHMAKKARDMTATEGQPP